MYFKHPIKCLSCSLHYVVASERADWGMGETDITYCPECGNANSKLRFAPVETEGFIFEFVPGSGSLMAGIPVEN